MKNCDSARQLKIHLGNIIVIIEFFIDYSKLLGAKYDILFNVFK